MPPLKTRDRNLIALAIGQTVVCATQAATITVDSVADDANATTCTLRDAISNANREGGVAVGLPENSCENPSNGPDTIILPSSQTLNVTGSQSGANGLLINSYITIEGNGSTINIPASSIPSSGSPSVINRRLFYVQAGGNLILNNTTVSGGDVSKNAFLGGAMYVNGIATLNSSTVSGNTAFGGGGIYSKGGLYLNDSTVTGNSATGTTGTNGGGGILVNAGNLFVTQNSEIINNQSATAGGGISVLSGASVALSNSTISENRSPTSISRVANGGGVYVRESLTFDVTESVVSNNTAYRGGGILIGPVIGLGGGIDNTANITGTVINNNFAPVGGGIFSDQVLNINNTSISENTASDGGGLSISNTTFLINSTVSRNTSNTGAAIRNFASLEFNNSTVSGNIGLGIAILNFGTTTLINSTVTAASSASSLFSTGQLVLKNSVITNSNGSDCELSAGTVTADSSNIISDGTCNTNALAVDPQLMPLADNGGPTLTHALSPNSPARNIGVLTDCPTNDQRGVERDFSNGFCDIGSFEFVGDDEVCFVVPTVNLNTVTFCL